MKKLLAGCLCLFLAACNVPTATPVAPLFPTATFSPTPVPVTVTPASTPTPPAPQFTATPFPRFFSDEFDDASLTGWVILQAGNDAVPNVKTENSTLILEMDSPYTWAYALYGAQDYEDIRIEAQFANQAGSPASIGLICRYSETDGWFEYNVSTDGTYNVLRGKWLASGIADYVPVVNGSSSAIRPSGTAQQIGLTCSGTTLSFSIDQNIIRNIDISRYKVSAGKAGIAAASFENTPIIAAFDWVKVSAP